MDNGYIAILDSGIGGFSCLIEAVKLLPNERFLYFGDNANAPYGNKSIKELLSLTQRNLDEILKQDVKAVICACNTLSTSVLPLMKKSNLVPIFGVYPPVNEMRGRTLLFATPITCAHYRSVKGLSLFPLKDLAADIERNKFDLSKVDIGRHVGGYVASARTGFTDTLILGCTHYFFVKNQFINHFCPQKTISGEECTAKRLYSALKLNDLLSNREQFTVDFIGNNAEENYNFYISVVKNILLNQQKK